MKMPYLVSLLEDEEDLRGEIRKRQDEFLDVYSFYLRTGFSWIRDEVRLKAYELHLLDSSFTFQI